MHYLRKKESLVTLGGGLTSLLLLWAQLWATIPGINVTDDDVKHYTIALGLAWTYTAALMALISTMLAAVAKEDSGSVLPLTRPAVFFFALSCCMLLAVVFQAAVSPLSYVVRGQALGALVNYKYGEIGFTVVNIIAVAVFSLSAVLSALFAFGKWAK